MPRRHATPPGLKEEEPNVPNLDLAYLQCARPSGKRLLQHLIGPGPPNMVSNENALLTRPAPKAESEPGC